MVSERGVAPNKNAEIKDGGITMPLGITTGASPNVSSAAHEAATAAAAAAADVDLGINLVVLPLAALPLGLLLPLLLLPLLFWPLPLLDPLTEDMVDGGDVSRVRPFAATGGESLCRC